MTWHRLGRTVDARMPLRELRAAFARTDIVALDLDQCIFPGYTQSELSWRVAKRLVRRPERPGDRRLLARLGARGAWLGLRELKRLLGLATPMRRLAARYERAMAGIPEHYVRAAAAEIPAASFPFAAETVAELGSRAPTGLVTLGLDVVAQAYLEQFTGPAGPSLSFFDANVVVFRRQQDGRVFHRYDPEAFLEHGEDKRRALERRMGARGAMVPTTVGHSADDLPLARLSRERGGVAIGFNPAPALAQAFDVVVRGRDWEPMYALVAALGSGWP